MFKPLSRLGRSRLGLRYSSITARVLLLGGQKSPGFVTTELFEGLQRAIPNAAAEIMEGLDHQAPEEKAPDVIADRVQHYLAAPRSRNAN